MSAEIYCSDFLKQFRSSIFVLHSALIVYVVEAFDKAVAAGPRGDARLASGVA